MRKSKYLVGMAVAVAASFAIASVAQAAITNTMTVSSTSTKQQKKTPGATDLHVDIKTAYSAGTPAAQSASHNDLDLSRNLSFNPPKGQCNPATLAGTSTATADAQCAAELVGTGTALLCSPLAGCAATPGGGGVGIPAVIHAYNGVPQGGNPVLVLHTKPGGAAAATPPAVLVGTLIQSPVGGVYGKRLSTEVPDTSSTGVDLVDFDVTIPKLKTVKANKKTGKPAKFYIMGKCDSSKSWAFTETNTYRAGGGTATASATVPCTQKATPKKK